jgi:hypothetical protein
MPVLLRLSRPRIDRSPSEANGMSNPTDPESPAAIGRGCDDGRREISRRADPAHPCSDAVAAADLVRRVEPVIRRRARVRLRMQCTAQIAENDPY